MARPEKPRIICKTPMHQRFTSLDSPSTGIVLSLEEYETIHLIDYLRMTQAECATQMNIGRTTAQALYTQARQKLARFLVEGTYMEISGGNYQTCSTGCVMRRCGQNSAQKNYNKGEWTNMKIAVTYENREIFQHFGHTEQFKIYEVNDGKIISSQIVGTNGQGHGALADFLLNNKVNVLICGGIGGGAKNALSQAGIQIYPGAVGNADAQVESFLKGNLRYDPNTMCNHHSHEGGAAHDDGHVCGNHGCH